MTHWPRAMTLVALILTQTLNKQGALPKPPTILGTR